MKNYLIGLILMIQFSNCVVPSSERNLKGENKETKDSIETINNKSILNDYTKENLKLNIKTIKSIEYYYDGSLGKPTNEINEMVEYNKDGNRTIVFTYNSNGKLIDKATYNYLGQKPIEKVFQNEKGSILEKSNFEFNDNSQLIKVVNTKKSNGLITTLLIEYDQVGNESKNSFSSSDFSINQFAEMLYNKKRQMIKQTVTRDGFCGAVAKYSYNEKGDKYSEIIKDCSEKISSQKEYEYTYDNNKNWVKRIEFDNSNASRLPMRLVKRELSYF